MRSAPVSIFGLRFAIAFAVWSAACGGPSGTGNAAQAQATKPALGQGTASQNLINAYLVVQAKLAHDEAAAARAAYGDVVRATRADGLAIAPELRKRAEAAAEAGSASAEIAKQRAAFAALSDALLAWFAVQENPLAARLTIAHCPMALDGKGAKWLQLGEPIKNPYFGAQMLSCGSVDATLPPGKKL
jgi:membrane fusion protein, copper/silver efflux system